MRFGRKKSLKDRAQDYVEQLTDTVGAADVHVEHNYREGELERARPLGGLQSAFRTSKRTGARTVATDVDYGELPAQDPPPPPPDPPVGVHDARKTTRTPKPRCEEFPDHLERRDEVIDVPESERAGLVRIGEDVTERRSTAGDFLATIYHHLGIDAPRVTIDDLNGDVTKLKATGVAPIALGAKAVLIGRAYAYGLGAAGGPGVARAIQILKSDVVRTMQLLGVASVRQIDRTFTK